MCPASPATSSPARLRSPLSTASSASIATRATVACAPCAGAAKLSSCSWSAAAGSRFRRVGGVMRWNGPVNKAREIRGIVTDIVPKVSGQYTTHTIDISYWMRFGADRVGEGCRQFWLNTHLSEQCKEIREGDTVVVYFHLTSSYKHGVSRPKEIVTHIEKIQ
jgi:hypothetical protein